MKFFCLNVIPEPEDVGDREERECSCGVMLLLY